MATGLERTAVDPMTGRAGTAPARQRTGVVSTARDPRSALIERTSQYPEYGQLLDYLSMRDMVPPMRFEYGIDGVFRYPVWGGSQNLPESGVIGVHPRSGPNTLIHETTHAADRQILKQYLALQYKKGELTPLEKQFMQTYEKLVRLPRYMTEQGQSQDQRQTMAQRMNPAWLEKNSQYRASSDELPAWGMGQSVAPESTSYAAPLHLDPTMATEFSILLDMAKRLQKTRPSEGR